MLFGLWVAGSAGAATLPPHAPLRILIVSDGVNPHGLTDAQLTQPGDLSAAIAQPGSGISIDPAPESLIEISTSNLPDATARLSVPANDPAAYDVLLYFSHRAPNAPDQAAFVAAVEAFLTAGGGVVSFHHGSFLGSGKAAIQELIGASATSIAWDTTVGQTVINVAPAHFVTTWEVEYPDTTAYDDAALGIPPALYGSFVNLPDERYPLFAVNASAGDIEVLFASNYAQSGDRHLLGFTHRQPGWAGLVVAYQPGEYQPNALDDLDGNNFQILANSLLYAATAGSPSVPIAPPWARVLGATLLAALVLRSRGARRVRALWCPGT